MVPFACVFLFSLMLSGAETENHSSSDLPPVEIKEASLTRDNGERVIPLLIYLPETPKSKSHPVILFSHGLGGSRQAAFYLGKHWAQQGYIAVFMQHPGSDERLWKARNQKEAIQALKSAANKKQFFNRLDDTKKVLDQLEIWQKEQGHFLEDRMDLEATGMAGHSFGAITTQALSGQSFPFIGQGFQDKRIRAAMIMSPGPAKRGSYEDNFGRVSLPWLLITGSEDHALFSETMPKDRQKVFDALPEKYAYMLWLEGATHLSLVNETRNDQKAVDTRHLEAIKEISTRFWDAHLKKDPDAHSYLKSDQVHDFLTGEDQWRHPKPRHLP